MYEIYHDCIGNFQAHLLCFVPQLDHQIDLECERLPQPTNCKQVPLALIHDNFDQAGSKIEARVR